MFLKIWVEEDSPCCCCCLFLISFFVVVAFCVLFLSALWCKLDHETKHFLPRMNKFFCKSDGSFQFSKFESKLLLTFFRVGYRGSVTIKAWCKLMHKCLENFISSKNWTFMYCAWCKVRSLINKTNHIFSHGVNQLISPIPNKWR